MPLDNLSWDIVLWCTFALACGGLIKGTLGVGTPLLTVPLMALVLPAQSAVALMAMPIVAANIWQAAKAPDLKSGLQQFWPAAVALLCGTFIGTSILSVINERTLLLLVGFSVIGFTLLQATFPQAATRTQMANTSWNCVRHAIRNHRWHFIDVRTDAYCLPDVAERSRQRQIRQCDQLTVRMCRGAMDDLIAYCGFAARAIAVGVAPCRYSGNPRHGVGTTAAQENQRRSLQTPYVIDFINIRLQHAVASMGP